jgi:hypothetical protein
VSWIHEYQSLSQEKQAAVNDAVIAAKDALKEHGFTSPDLPFGFIESLISYVKDYDAIQEK